MLSAPLIALTLLAPSAPERDGSAKLFQRIRGSVFEVVVAKFVDTGATYATPLPVDQVAYQSRKDSVWSIGTAFAVGKDTVLTAAHVLSAGIDDPSQEPMLRDANGRVFRIGKFLKYSNHQDLALFTVPGLAIKQPIRPAKKTQIGQAIHAVGNALGDGIVMRDGLLTSQTPESDNGQWMHWRFSAAASPGNSGGPLLDDKGALVGVVLMKSESENLNYALPWSVVSDFAAGTGRFRQEISFEHPAYEKTEVSNTLDTTFALPPTWVELDHKVWALQRDRFLSNGDSLLRLVAPKAFPRGKSAALRSNAITQILPTTMTLGKDDQWTVAPIKVEFSTDQSIGGKWMSSNVDGYIRFLSAIPDSVRVLDYVEDSRKLGDLILANATLERTYAGKEIRVTSLGKAVVDSLHMDRWGRPWLVRAWRQPWDRHLMFARLLLLPGGITGMIDVMSEGSARSIGNRTADDAMEATLTIWSGSGKHWRQWQQRPELVPTFLRGLKFNDSASPPEVAWSGNKLKLVPEIAGAPKKPFITIYPGFSNRGKDSVAMDIAGVGILDQINPARIAMVMRVHPPTPELPPELHQDWKEKVEVDAPQDGTAIDQDGGKKIAFRVFPSSLKTTNVDPAKSASLWLGTVVLDGTSSKRQVEKALQKTISAATIQPEPAPK